MQVNAKRLILLWISKIPSPTRMYPSSLEEKHDVSTYKRTLFDCVYIYKDKYVCMYGYVCNLRVCLAQLLQQFYEFFEVVLCQTCIYQTVLYVKLLKTCSHIKN
jgi:hypothetical protein